MIVVVQYVGGGQVRTFINGGGKGGVTGQGGGTKKVTLGDVAFLVDKGERVDR